MDFDHPTPIQSQAWPIALSGRNIVGIAKTGSGKTLSYLIPALIHVQGQSRSQKMDDGPICLILVPTRELAQQVASVAKKFLKSSSLRIACFFGGVTKLQQMQYFEKGTDIIISTPGRLLDFLEMKILNLHSTTFFVLDEADRMLDLGFELQIKDIIKQMRPDRQVLMFSATWPQDVIEMAEEYLDDYIHVNVGSMELQANTNIKQEVIVCSKKDKPERLQKVLINIMKQKDNKTLIFVTTKVECHELSLKLKFRGWRSECLHGDKLQKDREFILNQFKAGMFPILVATNVAGRGLDMDDISYVIIYEFPESLSDYVHRIGRTARAEKTGTAYTFLTLSDSQYAKPLIDVLTESKQNVDPLLRIMALEYEKGPTVCAKKRPSGKKTNKKNKFKKRRTK